MSQAEKARRHLAVISLSLALLAAGCSKEPSTSTSASAPPPATPENTAIVSAAPNDAAPALQSIEAVSLQGKDAVAVSGSDLTVYISQSSHKIRAPLAMVSILVSRGEEIAEVAWRIESNKLDGEWMPLEGRRYDEKSESYVEEVLAGWLVRLDSIDETSANASPTAITVSFKRSP